MKKFFTEGTHHEWWPFVGGSMAAQQSKMAAASIFNFGKISKTPDWIKISAPNFMERCIRDMRRWPSDQKLIRMTSSNECREQKVVDLSDCNRYLIFEPNLVQSSRPHCEHGEMCQIHLTWQKAQLSQRDRAMLRVIEYFAKSPKVTQDHSK